MDKTQVRYLLRSLIIFFIQLGFVIHLYKKKLLKTCIHIYSGPLGHARRWCLETYAGDWVGAIPCLERHTPRDGTTTVLIDNLGGARTTTNIICEPITTQSKKTKDTSTNRHTCVVSGLKIMSPKEGVNDHSLLYKSKSHTSKLQVPQG